MPRRLDYFLSISSPWAYIGHPVLLDIAGRHGLDIVYKPVFLGNIFAETGGLPLPKRHPARQRYRYVELQRWRDKRGLSFNIRPKYWPFDVNLVDRVIIAIAMSGGDPGAVRQPRLRGRLGTGAEPRRRDDAGAHGERSRHRGRAPLLARARSEAAEHAYEQNFRDAVACDVFGSPSYVLDGEVFWGQDRLSFLEEALQTERLPYTPVV